MLKAVKTYGSSMYPFIKNGDSVFYIKKNKYRKGEIVLYRYMDKLYIHRIIGKDNNYYLISNDDNLDIHRVKSEDILGKVLHYSSNPFFYYFSVILKKIRRIKNAVIG